VGGVLRVNGPWFVLVFAAADRCAHARVKLTEIDIRLPNLRNDGLRVSE
jgi:hypothetical protein